MDFVARCGLDQVTDCACVRRRGGIEKCVSRDVWVQVGQEGTRDDRREAAVFVTWVVYGSIQGVPSGDNWDRCRGTGIN